MAFLRLCQHRTGAGRVPAAMAQLAIALAQIHFELRFQMPQLLQLSLYISQFRLQQAFYR
jgi:hypothetical protein